MRLECIVLSSDYRRNRKEGNRSFPKQTEEAFLMYMAEKNGNNLYPLRMYEFCKFSK